MPPIKKKFTPEIDDFIRENYNKLSVSELARRISRMAQDTFTRGSIVNRMRRLGIRYVRRESMSRAIPGRKYLIHIGKEKISCIYYIMHVKDQPAIYFMCALRRPYYATVAKTMEGAVKCITARFEVYFWKKFGAMRGWTWEQVNECRRLWNTGDYTLAMLAKKFNKKYIGVVIYNKIFIDKNYIPIEKDILKNFLTLFGETKDITEWARDPRCEVSKMTLFRRYKKNYLRDESIVKDDYLTLFGETKSLREWSKDERCEIPLSAVRTKYKNGYRNENILRKTPRHVDRLIKKGIWKLT